MTAYVLHAKDDLFEGMPSPFQRRMISD